MRPDLPILAFDTSGPHLALHITGPVRVDRHIEMQKGQAERLIPECQAALAEAGLGWRDIGAIAVGVGPGNFTGIRIAVAAARGLSLALGVPAVGVTAFEIAHQAFGRPDRVMVSLAAPRGDAYVQTFVNGVAVARASVLTPGAPCGGLCEAGLPPDLTAGLTVLGHRAEEIAHAFSIAWATPKPRPDDAATLAATIADIAARKLCSTVGPWTARPAPLYVRAADAAPPSELPPVILDAVAL